MTVAYTADTNSLSDLQRRKTYNYVLTEAEKQAVLPVAQQRQASIAGGHPLTSGLGAHLRIMELSSSQRIRFMKVLLLPQLPQVLTQ